MGLAQKRCIACTGAEAALDHGQISLLAPEVPEWKVVDDKRLERRFTFRNFKDAMAFVTKMALVAEAEDHHPDFAVQYKIVDVTLWTHAVRGLHENDFILAAKLDLL